MSRLPKPDRDTLIALAVTILFAAITLCVLLFTNLSSTLREAARLSTPEISMEIPEEDTFVEPEILRDLGEDNSKTQDAPAPALKGDPKHDIKDNAQKREPGKNPKPAPPEEKRITEKKESPVKADEPSITDEERKRVTSTIAKGFEGKNGANTGKPGTSGAGGTGAGISGVASGRTFKGCPKPDVELRHKTTVKVNVTIDAAGNVTSAQAKGGAPAYIRRACEAAARGAKWSAKPDSPVTSGTITFTITPR